ncbi:angiotensin-converting enzyme [Parasteatoda tepidariorum]|uniref:angiotensin-converting enzyme n=1 Tax=Parasteatoda tepidariorum TaxID=114398 RepID=UPI0039BD2218
MEIPPPRDNFIRGAEIFIPVMNSLKNSVLCVFVLILPALHSTADFFADEVATKLAAFNDEFAEMWWLHQSADWNYSTNITSENARAHQYALVAYSDWMRKWKLWAKEVRYTRHLNPQMKRDLDIMASGVVFMNSDDAKQISEIKSKLLEIYSSATVTIPGNRTLVGEETVMAAMASIREPFQLKHIWKTWIEEVGEKGKHHLLGIIQLTNKAARDNGYSDTGEAWRAELGMEDLVSDVLNLWNDVKGFYGQLHAYTNHRLRMFYGHQHFRHEGYIPAHLLVNMWGENWSGLNDILQPYPEHPNWNVSSILREKGFTLSDVFRTADTMYTSMGLEALNPQFWYKSMFEKPKDGRIVDCHSVSYDFALNDDFRVRMCGSVNEETLRQAVHEMGHIRYYMAYHHQPMLYRNGANSAFHEAVGETFVYASQNPHCLTTLGLIQHSNVTKEQHLNILMKQALSKFVLLPFALTVELWRYALFSHQIDDIIKKWWDYRKAFQGIEPPDDESAELFEPGSKYHILNNIPYMRYFVSRFLEHEFMEGLCDTSGAKNDPFCCFITSHVAGERLKRMLSLGSSASWEEALKVLIKKKKITSSSLLKYFEPLHNWLIQYNRVNNISVYL